MSNYSHRYSVTTCPNCGNDLAAEHGVFIEAVSNVGGTSYIPSRLDDRGLLVDVKDVVADGYHSDTLCSRCDQPLNEYELEVEDESPSELYWGDNGQHEYYENRSHTALILRNHEETHWSAHRNYAHLGFAPTKEEAAKLLGMSLGTSHQWQQRGAVIVLNPVEVPNT